MTSPRTVFAAQLEAAIADDDEITVVWKVIPDARELGEPDPSIDCYLQVIRQVIEPNPENPRGQFRETWELWAIVAHTIDDTEVEDELDERVAEAIAVVRRIAGLTFKRAEHAVHKSQRQGYKLTVEVASSPTT